MTINWVRQNSSAHTVSFETFILTLLTNRIFLFAKIDQDVVLASGLSNLALIKFCIIYNFVYVCIIKNITKFFL